MCELVARVFKKISYNLFYGVKFKSAVTSEKSPVIAAEHSIRPSNLTLHLTEPLQNQ